jgi:hypothetical protein
VVVDDQRRCRESQTTEGWRRKKPHRGSKHTDIPKLQTHGKHIPHIHARERPKVHIHTRRHPIQHPLHLNLRRPSRSVLRQLPLNITPHHHRRRQLLPSLPTVTLRINTRHYFRLALPKPRLREDFPQERLNIPFRIAASPLRALSIANAR